jgi:hypothetical protein
LSLQAVVEVGQVVVVVATQEWFWQVAAVTHLLVGRVHDVPSEALAQGLAAFWQTYVVGFVAWQTWGGVQGFAPATQVPLPLHVSLLVQGFASASQLTPAAALVTEQVNVASPVERQAPAILQAGAAGQTTGVPTQTPLALQASPEVQPLASVQAEPADLATRPHAPVLGAQTLSLQAVVEVGQVVVVVATQEWFWQVAAVTHLLVGKVHDVPSMALTQGLLLAGVNTYVWLAERYETELVAVTVKVSVEAFSAPAGTVQVPAVVKLGSRPRLAGLAGVKLVPVFASTAHEKL